MRIIRVILASVLVSTLAVAQSRVGEPAADFTLQSLEGDAVSLSDFKGQVVFINFFGFN